MNNFVIEHDWMIYDNLPDKRWKVRRIKNGREKHLRHLEKESNRLYNEILNLGYEPLDKPIQAGYKRLFILTEETKHLKNIEFYQGILDKINTIRYSSTKVFETNKSSKRWRRRKRKKKEQKLLEPDYHTFHKVQKFTEDESTLFYEIKHYCHQCKKEHLKYVFSEPWRFMLRIRQHWITEVKRKDTILEQKYGEISKFIERKDNQGTIIKMRGGDGGSWKKYMKKYDPRAKYKYNPLKNKPLHEIEEEYNNEKQSW